MNKDLANLQDLKSAFVSHCKTLGCSIDYITMCKIMFANIENALKENENKLKSFEIIKENFANIGGTRGNFEGKKPTNEIVITLKDLTKEKFDLLKEELL